jgi:two-component system, NtrC family, sensor kinase
MVVSASNSSMDPDHPQDALQVLDAIRLIVETLSFSSQFENAFKQMIEGICRLLESEAGAIVVMEESGKVASRKLIFLAQEQDSQIDVDETQGALQTCLATAQPVCINDANSDPRFDPAFDSVQGLPVRSILCVPLVIEGQIFGVLEAINKRRGAFDTYDQDLLVMIASLAARTLYGRRLIRQLEESNTRLETNRRDVQRSRNTLRALFDNLPAGLYIVDHQYRLIAINMSWAERAHKMPKEMVGLQCYETLYSHHEACPGCRVSETLADGSSTVRPERRWGTGDEPTEWEISTYPIYDENEQVVQAILLEQDVTEKHRMEGIIAQSEKLAAVGQLAAGVAHEINNPLTAIIANAQLLQRQLPPEDDLQESVELIAQAGARATQVVRNLLDFARKEEYHLAATDINETVQRALALVHHELLSRSIVLDFKPDPDLPMIYASQDNLQGVWLNLLLNAVDAVQDGTGKIKVITHQVGGEIRVEIEDNGKGIPAERLSRIFEPFYTTKAPGRGTGLGLSVCHRIVKQHGGDILVHSEVGKGSQFTVLLPIS